VSGVSDTVTLKCNVRGGDESPGMVKGPVHVSVCEATVGSAVVAPVVLPET
jgi:hypothetical protein